MTIISCVCITPFESTSYKILFKCSHTHKHTHIGGFNHRVKSAEHNNVIKVFAFWCTSRTKPNKIAHSDTKAE